MPDPRGTALVTGAARGIGRAIALALHARGFPVALVDRDSEAPEVLGAGLRYYQCDIADIAAHDPLIARVEAELGPLACLVNNAGVTSLVRGDMLALTPESFDRSVAVNLRGTFFLSQAVARRLLAQPATEAPRSLITISSINADMLGENRADYCMTKAALSMMSKLFAARLAEARIAVYEIRPGIIRTDMTAPAAAKYDALIAEGVVPERRWGEPADVAETVAALATGALPYTTGIHIDVAGGLQLHRL